MEECSADVDKHSDVSVSTDGKLEAVTSCSDTQQTKRVSKLSAKALAQKLERLQNDRKNKLNKAANLRETVQCLMQKCKVSEVQNGLDSFIKLCDEIRSIHGFLLGLLPQEEKDRHETWFKAKMMFNDEFIVKTRGWLSSSGVFESKAISNDDEIFKPDDVNRNDSVSNVGEILSKSEASCKSSTTSSARV